MQRAIRANNFLDQLILILAEQISQTLQECIHVQSLRMDVACGRIVIDWGRLLDRGAWDRRDLKVGSVGQSVRLDEEKAIYLPAWDIGMETYQYCQPNFPAMLLARLRCDKCRAAAG